MSMPVTYAPTENGAYPSYYAGIRDALVIATSDPRNGPGAFHSGAGQQRQALVLDVIELLNGLNYGFEVIAASKLQDFSASLANTLDQSLIKQLEATSQVA